MVFSLKPLLFGVFVENFACILVFAMVSHAGRRTRTHTRVLLSVEKQPTQGRAGRPQGRQGQGAGRQQDGPVPVGPFVCFLRFFLSCHLTKAPQGRTLRSSTTAAAAVTRQARTGAQRTGRSAGRKDGMV